MLRYYQCDTPYRAIPLKGGLTASAPPKTVRCPPLALCCTQAHICAMPHFATYRAITVRYPIKASTKEFCDSIATSNARYEKHRCWASKTVCTLTYHGPNSCLYICRTLLRTLAEDVRRSLADLGYAAIPNLHQVPQLMRAPHLSKTLHT